MSQTQAQYPGDPGQNLAPNHPGGGSPLATIRNSFSTSIGDIVFGMEDGTVSLFGLVFGVAASSTSSQAVLLAGATGAAAAAVSMAAGAYLDVTSQNSIAQYKIDRERQEIKDRPQEERKETEQWLRTAGFSDSEVTDVADALTRHPGALLKLHIMQELSGISQVADNPYGHAAWMFLADLVAAFTPVAPFLFLSYNPARLTSIIITVLLLSAVGIGRGFIAHKSIWSTWFETMVVAAAAAGVGVGIGWVVHNRLG